MRSNQTFRHAFTLIELLVVIAIMSLLVSILLPSLVKAKLLARSVVCLTNHRTLGTGFALYLEDNRYVLPRGADIVGGYKMEYRARLPDYLASDRAGICPNAADAKGKWHYSSNPAIMREVDSSAYKSGVDTLPYDDIGRFSQVVVLLDGAQYDSAGNAQKTAKGLDGPTAVWGKSYDPAAPDNDQPINPGPNEDFFETVKYKLRWRERGARGKGGEHVINVLFADWHAESVVEGRLLQHHLRPNRSSGAKRL